MTLNFDAAEQFAQDRHDNPSIPRHPKSCVPFFIEQCKKQLADAKAAESIDRELVPHVT